MQLEDDGILEKSKIKYPKKKKKKVVCEVSPKKRGCLGYFLLAKTVPTYSFPSSVSRSTGPGFSM